MSYLRWISPLLAVVYVGTMLTLASCSRKAPGNLGVHQSKLLPCPSSPNCVSSQATDKKHYIAPYEYAGPRELAQNQLQELIKSLPRTKIIEQIPGYFHAEFTTPVFRFVDDVECFFPKNSSQIHIRSASRVGRSDLGLNRRRMESIRKAWKAR